MSDTTDKLDRPAFVVGCWQRSGQTRKMQQSELLPVSRKKGLPVAFNPNRKMSFIVLAVVTRGRDLIPVVDWYDIPPRCWLELEAIVKQGVVYQFRGNEVMTTEPDSGLSTPDA